MPPNYLPLRWEITGDQWWYASPIDWAAANGHYDLVRELLRNDANLLIKLTSLRRIRRLERVWDDDAQFVDVAKCRASVARSLFLECEAKKRKNTLIRAGYGGWLLYTAASAGDLAFVQDLLEIEPHLVFGEGEYGVTDVFYAAARSKSSQILRLLLDFAVSPRSGAGESDGRIPNVPKAFRWEMTNRAIHAAARGGNLEVLKELHGDGSNILAYRDAHGGTLLHAAAGRGQVEVVKDLLQSYDIITSTDNQGNTALHIAAYWGHLGVLEVLIQAFPSLAAASNYAGETFLHSAVAGFSTPGFQRLDRKIELMRQLVFEKTMILQDVVNARNNEGKTALHMAVIGKNSNLVELLMSVPHIDINIHDVDHMTPLDLLIGCPQSSSSQILIKRLISAGGLLNSEDGASRREISSCLKMQCPSGSPGTSFGIPDAEVVAYFSSENASDAAAGQGSSNACSSTSRIVPCSFQAINGVGNDGTSSDNNSSRRLKILIGWRHQKKKKAIFKFSDTSKGSKDGDLQESFKEPSLLKQTPTPLRQHFLKPSSLSNSKQTVTVRTALPSPSTKKKIATDLPFRSSSSPLPGSFRSSPISYKKKGIVLKDDVGEASCSKTPIAGSTPGMSPKLSSANSSRLMNHYFCFGERGISVEESIIGNQTNQAFKHSVISAAG